MSTLTIEVTQGDIDLANTAYAQYREGDHANLPSTWCPIAQAIKREFPDSSMRVVGVTRIWINKQVFLVTPKHILGDFCDRDLWKPVTLLLTSEERDA